LLTSDNLTLSIAYADNGNISSKSDAGTYLYDNTKVHAVVEVDDNTGTIPSLDQDISYNEFNKVSLIEEDTKKLEFNYGPDEERRMMMEYTNNNLQKTTYYLSNYEEIEINNSVAKKTHYIYGLNGLIAIMIEGADQSQTFYYTCTDHLGSITALVNTSGTVTEEFSYDAWGRRRNAEDWTFVNVPASQTITRGYTGHEHLDGFGLINMNGRIYDPVLGRFAQPDILVQEPNFTQSYNRYSYCMNNPVKFTDPSGYTCDLRWYYAMIANIEELNNKMSWECYAGFEAQRAQFIMDMFVSLSSSGAGGGGEGGGGGSGGENGGGSSGTSQQNLVASLAAVIATADNMNINGNPRPVLAWDRKNGIIVFGFVVEGPGCSGGLMGDQGNDGANAVNIDWSISGVEWQNTFTVFSLMTGVYSLTSATSFIGKTISALSLGNTLLNFARLDYNANIELGIIKTGLDAAFVARDFVKPINWINLPSNINTAYQNWVNWKNTH